MKNFKNALSGLFAFIVLVGMCFGKVSKVVKPAANVIKEAIPKSEALSKIGEEILEKPGCLRAILKSLEYKGKLRESETQDSLNIPRSGVSIDDFTN